MVVSGLPKDPIEAVAAEIRGWGGRAVALHLRHTMEGNENKDTETIKP